MSLSLALAALAVSMLTIAWAGSKTGFEALERKFAVAALPSLELTGREDQLLRWFHISVLAAAAGTFAGVLLEGLAMGLLLGGAGSAVPLLLIQRMAVRRVAQIERQLPGALDALAAALRSGQSVQQAVAWVGKESPRPTNEEFSRLAKELTLGRTLEDGLHGMALRLPAPGLKTLAMTMGPLRAMGANLIPALEGMADILRRRAATGEKLSSLAAQGKMQLWVMGLMLPALSLVVFSMEPHLIARLFTHWHGNLFVILAVLLEFLAVVLARRILDPKRMWEF